MNSEIMANLFGFVGCFDGARCCRDLLDVRPHYYTIHLWLDNGNWSSQSQLLYICA